MSGKGKEASGKEKQYDTNKYPIFTGKKADLANRERLAKMFWGTKDSADGRWSTM